jgi:bifunctional DNase/RNase
MVEVTIFTVVVAHPQAPSVVVLAEKGAVSRLLDLSLLVPGGTSTLDTTAEQEAKQAEPKPEVQEKEAAAASALDEVAAAPALNEATASALKDNAPTAPQLTLDDTDPITPQLLPIWIGHSEAEAILILLGNTPHTRPLTHDLLAAVIDELGGKVEKIVVDKVMSSTFYATVHLDRDGSKLQVDARPSDSIALALRTGAGIFVDEDVMNVAARKFRLKVSDGGELLYSSEDEMEHFHSFIESVSPEDFTL